MTERELKQYALIGLLVRIKAEQDRLDKPIDDKTKEQIKIRLDPMSRDYNTLLDELRNEKPL